MLPSGLRCSVWPVCATWKQQGCWRKSASRERYGGRSRDSEIFIHWRRRQRVCANRGTRRTGRGCRACATGQRWRDATPTPAKLRGRWRRVAPAFGVSGTRAHDLPDCGAGRAGAQQGQAAHPRALGRGATEK